MTSSTARRRRRTRQLAAAAASSLVLLVQSAGASAATPADCGARSGAAAFPTATPAAAGFDPAALNATLDAFAQRYRGSTQVVRNGCLVAERYSQGADAKWQSFSTAKSVTAMAIGRAVQLGLLSLDDRVGALVPEADRAHGDLTLRQLMNMVTGWHFNWVRDNDFTGSDHLTNALTLPFDFAPGVRFEYLNMAVALAGEMLARATGGDAVRFVKRELFAPLGIPADAADIQRDRTGRMEAYWGVHMPERYWSRLGQLMLQDGRWGAVQLLPPAFVEEAQAGTTVNPCYSLFFWTNRGDTCTIDTQAYRTSYPHPATPFAPRDTYSMEGITGQVVWIVPSLGLVVSHHSDSTLADFPKVYDLLSGVLKAIVAPAPVASAHRLPASSALDGEHAESGPEAGIAGALTVDAGSVLKSPQVATQTLPPAGPTRARTLRFVSTRLVLHRDRSARLRVACPPVARLACAGTVTLRAADGRPLAQVDVPATPAGSRRTLTLGLRGRLPRVALATAHVTDDADGVTSTARLSLVRAHGASPARPAHR